MNILLIGPKQGVGGISAVIDTVLSSWNYSEDKLLRIETSVYKEGGLKDEILTFCKAVIQFFIANAKYNLDVIHIHSSFRYSFFRKSIFLVFCRLLKKKTILHIHASDFYSFFIYQENRWVKKYIAFILKNAIKVVVLCHDWEEKLKLHFKLTNTTVIKNPCQNENIYPKESFQRDKVSFLFMGFYISSKGILDLLQATAELHQDQSKPLELILCGKGEMEGQIDSFIKIKEMSKSVFNKGWVSGIEKENIFRNADVFVLPSCKEGMPMVILEAFAYGLPVISTYVSGIPEIIQEKENGLLFQPGDVFALIKCMRLLRDNVSLRQKMSNNNLEYVKYFHPSAITREWRQLYQKVSEA